MAISHAGHNHPATPAARSACRKRMDNGQSPRDESAERALGSISDRIARTRPERKANLDRILGQEIRMTGAVARRMARQAVKADNARIQPRRSGARVSARNTSCVQAALHIDAHGGRCACGWSAAA